MVWVVLSIIIGIMLLGIILILLICNKFDRMYDELEQLNDLEKDDEDDKRIN